MKDLTWALAFFVLTIVCMVLGFTGLPGLPALIAKVLSFVFLASMIVATAVGAFGSVRRPARCEHKRQSAGVAGAWCDVCGVRLR